jgi:hypothetical protein
MARATTVHIYFFKINLLVCFHNCSRLSGYICAALRNYGAVPTVKFLTLTVTLKTLHNLQETLIDSPQLPWTIQYAPNQGVLTKNRVGRATVGGMWVCHYTHAYSTCILLSSVWLHAYLCPVYGYMHTSICTIYDDMYTYVQYMVTSIRIYCTWLHPYLCTVYGYIHTYVQCMVTCILTYSIGYMHT